MHPFSTDPGWYQRHWYGLRPGRTFGGSGQHPLPSRSTVTLAIAVYFIAASMVAALLATNYGWLDAALVP